MRTTIPSHPRPPGSDSLTIPPVAAMELWGTHPTIAAGASDGHHVVSVYPFGSNLLLGYGDWTNNTGPVDLVGLALADASPQTLFAGVRTESIEAFREINGALYVPWIDTDSTADSLGGGYLTNAGGTWHEVVIPGYVHVFDMLTSDGTDLVVAGAFGSRGGVHRSTDGGATWSDISPPGSATFIRLRQLAAAGGSIFQHTVRQQRSPAGVWSEWPVMNQHDSILAAKPVLDDWLYLRGIAINSTTLAVVEYNSTIRPETTDGTYVYGSRWWQGAPLIYRTPGPVDGSIKWEPLLLLPAASLTPQALVSGTSIAVLGGYVYAGGPQGKVFRTPLPT